MQTKTERLDLANRLLEIIGSHGRRLFHHDGRVARLELTPTGKLFLHDEFTLKRVYVGADGEWHGFHHGATMKGVVQYLVHFVRTGQQLPGDFGGPHWAYGDAMQTVREEGRAIGVIGPPPRDYDAEMRLPSGKTCADCRHVGRCVDVLGCTKPENSSCDFHPIRFVATSVAEPAEATP